MTVSNITWIFVSDAYFDDGCGVSNITWIFVSDAYFDDVSKPFNELFFVILTLINNSLHCFLHTENLMTVQTQTYI
jgi:hypothetical protein